MLPRYITPFRAALVVCCGVTLAVVIIGWRQLGCPSANVTCAQGIDWTHLGDPMGVDYAVFANLAGVTDEAAASQAAAQTWNADRCDFTFTYVGPGSNNAPAYDGVNQIRWGNTGGSFVTRTMWLNMTTGDISEVDCVLGESFAWSTATPTPASAFDIESVLLHEFGHFLGLDHSTPPAIMQPTIPPGTQRRNLDTDDGAGCQAIYGTEQVGTPKPITVIGLFVLLVVALGALLSLRRNLVRA